MRGRKREVPPPLPPLPRPPPASRPTPTRFSNTSRARSLSEGTVEFTRWSLRGFLEWADSQHLTKPAAFTRAEIAAYQLHLHQYRSPAHRRAAGGQHPARPARRGPPLLRLAVPLRHHPRQSGRRPRPAPQAVPPPAQSPQPEEIDRAVLAAQPRRRHGPARPHHPRTALRHRHPAHRTDPNSTARDYDPDAHTLLVRHGKGGKSRLLPVGGRAAFWLDRYLAESRPLFDHLPNETALFLTGYGTRITPAYLGTWVAGQLKKRRHHQARRVPSAAHSLCHLDASERCGHPVRSGNARPRATRNHPDLHPCQH